MAGEAKYCGSICAPTVCATPRTMPPTSVPQSEPMPPMTTASNAKMSCVGPAVRVEGRAHRRGRRRRARRWRRRSPSRARRRARELTPTSSAVSGSSAVARSSRPSGVRARNSCSPPSTHDRDAERSARRSLAIDERWSMTVQLVVAELADLRPSERTSGEKSSKQQVLDHDREPERRQQRGELARAQAALEHRRAAAASRRRSIAGQHGDEREERSRCPGARRSTNARNAPSTRGRRARG